MFRRHYGAGPLHLIALLASLAIAGAAVVRWFDFASSNIVRVLIWFGAAAIVHDVVLLPLYSLLDRTATSRLPVDARAYLRVPAIVSAIVLLTFAPEILRLGDSTYNRASGQHQTLYLVRYLIFTGGLFALSGFLCAARLAGRRRRA